MKSSTEQFDGRLTRMYVSLTDSATASAMILMILEINTFTATGKPSNVRIATAQLAEQLEHRIEQVTGLLFP